MLGDWQSFSSIPENNKFRFTANSVGRNDIIALAVKMPRDFRFWFIGAFSVMLDVDGWRASNGVSAEEMTEIANNDVVFAEFCEFVADCIENDTDVQNAIENVATGAGTATTVINNTNYSGVVLISENADGNGCNDDARYGRILALIDHIDQVMIDFYESIDAATNVLGEVANLVSAIPLFETLPFDELITTIADTGEQLQDSYAASVTVALKESFACDLFCATSGCSVTLKDVREEILSRYNIDTTQGALNILSLAALFARATSTVASAGGLTYIGDDYVYISWLLQIAAVELSGQFFGLGVTSYVQASSGGSPSGAWSSCGCSGIGWEATYDFTSQSYSTVWSQEPYVAGVPACTYVPAQGWTTQTHSDGSGYGGIVTASASASFTITEISLTVRKLGGGTSNAGVFSDVPATAANRILAAPSVPTTSTTFVDTTTRSLSAGDKFFIRINCVSNNAVIQSMTVKGTGTQPGILL